MRDADFNVCQTSQGLETEANSLCRKILPVSPCTSRFWVIIYSVALSVVPWVHGKRT